MNLRAGRIGRQESVALAMLSMLISGIFSVNTIANYEKGNSVYFSSLLGALVSLAVFLAVCAAMRRCAACDLSAFFEFAFGGVIGKLAQGLLAVGLLLAASLPLIRMLLIMCRFIYVDSNIPAVAIYFLPCILFLSYMGLETISRTAKLFAVIVVLSLLLAFVIALPSYELYRLFPLVGNGVPMMLLLSLTGTSRFLPALTALLIVNESMQGIAYTASSGKVAAGTAAAITAGSQLCLGMTFSYRDLADMHSPMYRILMSVRTGNPYVRTDKVLLFIWTIGSWITSAFYVYAGAFVFSKAMRMRDIRPTAACFSVIVTIMALIGHADLPLLEQFSTIIWGYIWLAFLVPLLLATVISLFRKGRAA